MPVDILPASAAAFAPRSTVHVVLGSRVESWLTQALKRINRVRCPLNSIEQHTRSLSKTLSAQNAIWSLCSLLMPTGRKSADLLEAPIPYQLIHVEAYVVHVDMVLEHEASFKLTPATVDELAAYHKDIYSVAEAASSQKWTGKEQQIKELREEFHLAVNSYVFRTDVRVLEGLELGGMGELLGGRAEVVKRSLLQLTLPLLSPASDTTNFVLPEPLCQSSYDQGCWWAPTLQVSSSPAQAKTSGTIFSTPSSFTPAYTTQPLALSDTARSITSSDTSRPAEHHLSASRIAARTLAPYPSCSTHRPSSPLYTLPLPSMIARQQLLRR